MSAWIVCFFSRFHIHLYNQDSLIACVLPYHETRIFVRVIQLLKISGPKHKWFWLLPVKVRLFKWHFCNCSKSWLGDFIWKRWSHGGPMACLNVILIFLFSVWHQPGGFIFLWNSYENLHLQMITGSEKLLAKASIILKWQSWDMNPLLMLKCFLTMSYYLAFLMFELNFFFLIMIVFILSIFT